MEKNLNKPKATASMGESESQMPILLSFLVERANIVILLRLGSGILAIYFSLTQNFPAAIIAMLWSVLLGRHDGLVALATPGRSEFQKMMRVSMASPVDLISFAAGPAILLLSVGEFSGWFYPGALFIVMAGVLRLAYFNAYGVDQNGTYAGLPLDFTPCVVSAVCLFQNSLNHNVFAAILYATIVMLALLHVSPVRTPKTGRHMHYIITAFVLILTAIYSFILWIQ